MVKVQIGVICVDGWVRNSRFCQSGGGVRTVLLQVNRQPDVFFRFTNPFFFRMHGTGLTQLDEVHGLLLSPDVEPGVVREKVGDHEYRMVVCSSNGVHAWVGLALV